MDYCTKLLMMNHTNFAIDDPTNLRMMLNVALRPRRPRSGKSTKRKLNGSTTGWDSIGWHHASLGSMTTGADSMSGSGIGWDDAGWYLLASLWACPLPNCREWFEHIADRDCADWD